MTSDCLDFKFRLAFFWLREFRQALHISVLARMQRRGSKMSFPLEHSSYLNLNFGYALGEIVLQSV